MKPLQIKICALNQLDFTRTDDEYFIFTTEEQMVERNKIITVQESFFFRCWSEAMNIPLQNGMTIYNVVKIRLPYDKEDAMKLAIGEHKLYINNIEYRAYLATPTMQKLSDKKKGTCDMFFIKSEDYDKVIGRFEHNISFEKFNDVFVGKNEEIAINKNVTSRLSLGFSSSMMVDFTPNIIIVPDATYSVMAKTHYPTKNKDGKTILSETYEQPEEVTGFDGCGIGSRRVFNQVKKQLHKDYDISFIGLRMYGLGVKGVIVNVDFHSYFREFYKSDTKYFKKEDGHFYIKDVYNQWQSVTNADLIMPVSMCKWWDNFTSIDEYYNARNNLAPYCRNIYVCKVNHEHTKRMTRTNYQLLLNTTLTEADMKELGKYSFNIYNEILNFNLDYIKAFIGDIANEEDEYAEELSKIASDKVHFLLNVNDNFLRLATVRKTITRIVKKKIYEMMAGRVYVNGAYRIMSADPITFMHWLMNRSDNNEIAYAEHSLKEREFYINDMPGKKLVVSRNPLNSPWEIQKIETVKGNSIYDKYLGHLTDMIVLNQADLTASIMSGADFDMDGCQCIENEIIYNNVLTTDIQFKHIAEGDTKNLVYNDYNKMYALIYSSGNKIGSLAIQSAKISNECTSLYYLTDEKKHVNYKQIYKDEVLEQKFKSDELLSVLDCGKYDEFMIKKNIEKRFNRFKKYILELTELQMQGIDLPKTLVDIDESALTTLDSINIGQKKPAFLYYADKSKAKDEDKDKIRWEDYSWSKHNALNRYIDTIQDGLIIYYKQKIKDDDGKEIDNPKYIKGVRDNSALLHRFIKSVGLDKEEINRCIEIIKGFVEERSDKREECKGDKELHNLYDAVFAEKALSIHSQFTSPIICNALVEMNAKENKILKYFYKAVEEVLLSIKPNTYTFVPASDIETDAFEYLGYNYKKKYYILDESYVSDIQEIEVQRRYKKIDRLVSDTFSIGGINQDLINKCYEEQLEIHPILMEYDGVPQVHLFNKESDLGFLFREIYIDNVHIQDVEKMVIRTCNFSKSGKSCKIQIETV